MNITVFCSQYDVAEKYMQDAESFARLLGEHGHAIVWGGARTGMMGLVAKTTQRAGGRAIGVIREEIGDEIYADADEMHVVADVAAMNQGLIARGDTFVVLPGGIGTLHELTELLRMRKNKRHTKDVIVLNTDGFYDGIRMQLERMGREEFIVKDVVNSVHFADTPNAALALLSDR